MALKVQKYIGGQWWDVAYTFPYRAKQDLNMYFDNRTNKKSQPPHRVYNDVTRTVLYERP